MKGLTKNTGDQYALKDMVFPSKKENLQGLIGKNSAGKTTLIKIITQVLYLAEEPVSVWSQGQQEWTKALSHTGSVIRGCSSCPHVGLWKSALTTVPTGAFPNADKVIKETLQYVGLTDAWKKNSAISLWGWDSSGRHHCPFRTSRCSFGQAHQWFQTQLGFRNLEKWSSILNQELGITIIISNISV